MRRYYIDKVRCATVLLVVLYHVIYMYNGVATDGVVGPFCTPQYQDCLQYLLYPWFMVILFVVSGMCSRFYLDKHTVKEFVSSRTRKLLVPSTIGLFVFQWILGYFNMAIADAFSKMPEQMPVFILYPIMVVSGTGVLWYIQLLWLFSMVLALIRKMEKGKLYGFCEKANIWVLILLVIPVYGAAQILNTPVIAVYRFGIYGLCFLLGYFVFANDAVMERLFALLACADDSRRGTGRRLYMALLRTKLCGGAGGEQPIFRIVRVDSDACRAGVCKKVGGLFFPVVRPAV